MPFNSSLSGQILDFVSRAPDLDAHLLLASCTPSLSRRVFADLRMYASFVHIFCFFVYFFQLNGLLEEQEKSRRERKARMVSGADLISALRQQRRELESKCTSASARLRKIREETGFLWVGDYVGYILMHTTTRVLFATILAAKFLWY